MTTKETSNEEYEVSANAFIEAQTKQMEREFKCSRPRPRNRAMGFKGSDKPKRPWKNETKTNKS